MKTVVLGLSGGVDSAVAGLILKQQGYNVIGVFMKNWEDEEDGVCPAEQDSKDAQEVADKIGIPFYQVNFAKVYKEHVFKEFLEDLKNGITPNPDVLCNREVKFGPFLEYAKKLGADFVATGHYAKVEFENGVYQLKKCADQNKCQTYFLNQLSQEQLKYAMFPLAKLTKPQIRQIAIKNGLSVAKKKDSTGICFIGERKFKEFLKPYLVGKKGKIVTTTGKVIGEHDGLPYYTIGQKRGLGIGGIKGFEGASFCVVKKDMEKNELVVAPDGTDEVLFSGLEAKSFNFTGKSYAGQKNVKLTAKFRYRQAEQGIVATFENGGIQVVFDKKQRAITCGQYVVVYDGENVVGGGKITSCY